MMSDAFFHMPFRGKPSDVEPDAEGVERGGANEMGEGERGGNVAAAADDTDGKKRKCRDSGGKENVMAT
jgi:hypothetical protein